MANTSKTKKRPLHGASAVIIPFPSALSTKVKNIRIYGRWPKGVVSMRNERLFREWEKADQARQANKASAQRQESAVATAERNVGVLRDMMAGMPAQLNEWLIKLEVARQQAEISGGVSNQAVDGVVATLFTGGD